MIRLNWFPTSILWLHLEDFYNHGLTPEEAKAVIEALPDPGSASSYLQVEPSGVNYNWNVRTMANGKVSHDVIVHMISESLQAALTKKQHRLDPVPADPNGSYSCS